MTAKGVGLVFRCSPSRILMRPTSVHSSAKRLCWNDGCSHLEAPPGTATDGPQSSDLRQNCGGTAGGCLHVLAGNPGGRDVVALGCACDLHRGRGPRHSRWLFCPQPGPAVELWPHA